MRFIIIYLFIFTSLMGDEMQRIEAIVDDISKLRISYNECQKELKSKITEPLSCQKELDEATDMRILLENEKQKNAVLLEELNSLKKEDNSIDTLKNQIKEYENTIKSKNKEIKLLKDKRVVQKCNPKIITKKLENSNKFPKLVMKKEFQYEKVSEETIETFKASAFRLKEDTSIYDSINGKVIEEWEKETSFTSNQKTLNWVKITGYFIDKRWKKAQRELWVQIEKTLQR